MRLLAAAAVIVVAIASAGCGGGSSPSAADNGEAAKPATQVLGDALKAAKSATSVHISGHMTFAYPERLDVTVEKAKGFAGWFTVAGRKVDVAVAGSKSYVRASSAYWAVYASALRIADPSSLDGKWV